MNVVMVLILSILLIGWSSLADAQLAFPPSPVAPTNTQQCTALRKEYGKVEDTLRRQYSALGMGRGAHTDAGPCCRQLAAPGSGWCRVYQSHAATWEALHCAQVARDTAVDKCLSQVRSLSRDFAAAVGRAAEELDPDGFIAKANLYVVLAGRLDLVRQLIDSGHDPRRLGDITIQAAGEIARAAIKDKVAREFATQSLEILGVHQQNLGRALDQVTVNISRILASPPPAQTQPAPAPPPAAPSTGGMRVMVCKEARGGGAPVCNPTKYSVRELINSGMECERAGNEVRCF